MQIQFNPHDVTIGQLVRLEETSGRESVHEIVYAFNQGLYSGRDVLALVALTMEAEDDTERTYEECLEAASEVRVGDVDINIGLEEE